MTKENSLSKLKDRVLIIYFDDTEWEKYHKTLTLKDYEIEIFNEHNIKLIPKITFDLVVVCLNNISPPLTILSELKKLFLAPSTPCIIITDQQISTEFSDFPSVHVISYKEEITKFQVHVQIQLRLRKIRTTHIGSQVELSSENASLRDLNNRFQKDLIEAREIHEKILPNTLPDVEKIHCATAYLPLELVGGDLFDIWKIDSNKMGLFIGDITGHGLPAAFIASMTKMCLALAPSETPSQALSFVNNKLSKYLPEGRFISALYGIIDQQNKLFTYANAGHPPPLHFHKKSKEVETLNNKGIPLNIDPDTSYSLYNHSLDDGDMILLYSDGLYETVNMENKMMGIKGLAQEFKNLASIYEIEDLVQKLIEYQKSYSDGRLYKDDVTIIGIKV